MVRFAKFSNSEIQKGTKTGYTLSLTTYQMALLLLFEENEKLLISDIETATKMEKKTIYAALGVISPSRPCLTPPAINEAAPYYMERPTD